MSTLRNYPIVTTPEYRVGWDRIFGKKPKPPKKPKK